MKPDSIPNIAGYLCQGGFDSTEVVLNYVMDYVRKHPSIASAEEFHLSDEEYADFKQRVIESGFKYDRETSKVYDELVEMAKFEGYYDDAKDEFEALKTKLSHNLSRELDNNRTVISHLIEQSIITTYYYQKGSIACTLSYDTQVQEAVKLINDRERYESILK